MATNLQPDMKPACQDHEYLHPDAWFPEPPNPAKKGFKIERETMLVQGVAALKACAICPIKKECLEFSFKISDTIDWGIYGGTLSFERRDASKGDNRQGNRMHEKAIRRRAQQEGIPTPRIAKRKRAHAWIRELPEMLLESQSNAGKLGYRNKMQSLSERLSSPSDWE